MASEDLRAKRLLFFEGAPDKKVCNDTGGNDYDDLVSTAAPSTSAASIFAESLPSADGAAAADAQRRALYEKHLRQKRNTGTASEAAFPDYNPEYDSDPDGKPMVSHVSRSTKMTDKSRGPARRKQKEERARLHREKMGLETFDLASDARATNAAKSLFIARPLEEAQVGAPPPPACLPPLAPQVDAEAKPAGLRGSVAVSVHAMTIKAAERLGTIDKDVRKAYFFQGLAGDPEDQQGEDARRRWIVHKDGWPFCQICQKWAEESHLQSAGHRVRVEEDAIGQIMAGGAGSTRRFAGGGLPSPISQAGMLAYWGELLQCMPVEVGKRFAAAGRIKYQKNMLTPAHVAGFNLGAVSYSGAGTYGPGNKYYDWADLPNAIPESDDQHRWEAPAHSCVLRTGQLVGFHGFTLPGLCGCGCGQTAISCSARHRPTTPGGRSPRWS